ncbi:hypothetical protein A4A49_49316 [Nicotiana attenuata]|uniref:Uncharacterized protein n=1 Tax=Nicotiana attenuata TaxID=49451 RepID=A0A1J6HVB6_NICAT|nr:hypothetical protein A4A49_49316 [Nicotiana attenuata]
MSTLVEFCVSGNLPHSARMAKKMVNRKPWIEVAPPLVVSPTKLSHFSKLETIKEDYRAEEKNEDDKDSSF